MKIKKLILPIILILVFCLVYFIVVPFFTHRNLTQKFVNSFENGLDDLGIIAKKSEGNGKEYGAYVSYTYTLKDKKMSIYIFDKYSSSYKKGQKNGYIVSKNDKDFKLYGIFMNNCALYIEQDFEKSDEIFHLFEELSEIMK